MMFYSQELCFITNFFESAEMCFRLTAKDKKAHLYFGSLHGARERKKDCIRRSLMIEKFCKNRFIQDVFEIEVFTEGEETDIYLTRR